MRPTVGRHVLLTHAKAVPTTLEEMKFNSTSGSLPGFCEAIALCAKKGIVGRKGKEHGRGIAWDGNRKH